MKRRKLAKIRADIESLRRRKGNIQPRELIVLAKQLGRREVKRGKEPTYDRDADGWFPLSIPNHPGTLAIGTAGNILNTLEADVARCEDEIERTQDEE